MGVYLACQRGKHKACSDASKCNCTCHVVDTYANIRKSMITYAILGALYQEQVAKEQTDG